MTSVGIIANPASGKDIRRLVAHGSTFDNNEKINIVRRVLMGLDALDIEHVYYMPETYAIVPRAAEPLKLRATLTPLTMTMVGGASDSYEAARRLADLEVGALVTLGGDGTNRVVATGCGAVPLVPISTGTNNVFPRMVEGTLAGLAAGLVALGAAREAVSRVPRLEVYVDGELRDHALIDVATSEQAWVGARALWRPEHIREVVLSRVTASDIGLCSLGGLLFPQALGSDHGVHIVIGEGDRRVLAPLAPGLIHTVPIATADLLCHGQRARLQGGRCTVALDGERELELGQLEHELEVVLCPDGPHVVDIDAALSLGAQQDMFTADAIHTIPSARAQR